MKEYVIIGNGVAAAGCIEGIRSIDKAGRITVISEETHAVYCRPLISYYLEGKTDLSRMKYRGDDFYEKMQCRVLYGHRAVHIQDDVRTVELDDGTKLPYTDLCIAAGASPFIPSIDGLDSVRNRYSFITLDDALALEHALDQNSRVLIIGAGLIGLKCAEGIKSRVSEVSVCDLSDHILSSILDSECAALMQKHLEKHGIRFYLDDSVVCLNNNKADMKSGAVVEFDTIVLAVGVRPNTALIRDIGGKVDRGIIVDERMQTSVAGIYAAGDCTEGYDISSGQKRVLAILPNAYMQGHTAGVNMSGGSEVFDRAIPMNSVGFFGYHTMTAGAYDGDIYEEKSNDSIRRFFTKDDMLKGFILVGCNERAGIYTSLIRDKTPLSSLNFDILKKAATTAAFSAETRRKKFGGVV